MIKPLAYNLTRRDIHYRHEVFSAGLKAAGYQVESLPPAKGKPGDVLLIWNRYGQYHDIAKRFEQGGGTVIVAENGYLGKDETGNQLYALAIGGHNGSGQWNTGGPERFAALGVELQDWRSEGKHILVCPNRSFGRPDIIMPCDWTREVCEKIKRYTSREIRVRQHPAVIKPKAPLADDLAGAWAVVIWGSSAGVHALVAGVPVFQESPHWICASAASNNLAMIENPAMDHHRRLTALQKLAWAQWSLKEIETGAAFDHLLRTA
ncbi:MAG: hypothetical protein WC710_15040 [Gallionella sp.]